MWSALALALGVFSVLGSTWMMHGSVRRLVMTLANRQGKAARDVLDSRDVLNDS